MKNVPLHLLRPYERNAKLHPVWQLEGIAQSISQFGFLQPLVVDRNNVIVAGHGRYEAAAALGLAEVPCVIADELTPKQIRAYRILDNKLSETGIDTDMLSLELKDLDFDFQPFKVNIEMIGEEVSDIGSPDSIKEEPKVITCPACYFEFTNKKG